MSTVTSTLDDAALCPDRPTLVDTTAAAAPTLDEIKTTWPAAVSVEKGSNALGFSRAYGYALIRRGEFPAKVIKAGRRCTVITASLVRVLSGEPA